MKILQSHKLFPVPYKIWNWASEIVVIYPAVKSNIMSIIPPETQKRLTEDYVNCAYKSFKFTSAENDAGNLPTKLFEDNILKLKCWNHSATCHPSEYKAKYE